MSIRINFEMSSQLGTTPNGRSCDVGVLKTPTNGESSVSADKTGGSSVTTVGQGDTFTVPMPGPASFFALSSSRAVTVIIDGERIDVAKIAGFSAAYFVATLSDATVIQIENDSGASAEVKYQVVSG